MAFMTVGQENSSEIKIHYEDHGHGEPILMIHGFPFSGLAWEKQERRLIDAGHRVICYDRRGFGASSHPSEGYDYDTLAKDLEVLLEELHLSNVTLVGHSMGTGEIARYLGSFGSDRIRAAVFISPIPPFLLKTKENQKGVPAKDLEDFKNSIKEDRYAFMSNFLKHFYNIDDSSLEALSQEKLTADFNQGTAASPIAFLKCVDTWLTDFRDDLPKIDVPCLVIQGDADQILPIEATGKELSKQLKAPLKVIAGGSHGIPWTHADEITDEILDFLEKIKSKVSVITKQEGMVVHPIQPRPKGGG
jgi:non-heme chloroperoxidase